MVAGGQVPQIPLEVGPIDDNATVADIAGLVVATVAEVTGRPPVDVKLLPMRPGEQPGVVTADVSTLTMVGIDSAGFVPLAEGIRRTVEWFRTSEGVTWRSPG